MVTEGVAEEGGEGLGVDAGGDHQRGEGVAALVEADRLEAGGSPGPRCTLAERLVGERASVRAAEEEAAAPAAGEAVLEQVFPERGGHWDTAAPGAALG